METFDPLGRPIRAFYLYNESNSTAYVELAKASGIELLSNADLNVMETSTIGTGIQIEDAIKRGAKNIIIGLGGSATNDGGTGIAHALGYRFLDAKGNELSPKGKNLSLISKISKKENPVWKGISFTAVNDVTNPLFGKEGAAYVYAKQKGAASGQIEALDEGLRNLAYTVQNKMGADFAEILGTGAAGGTAYGLKTFFNAEFISGIELHYHIPVIAVCGKLDVAGTELKKKGLKTVLEIMDTSQPMQYSMDNAAKLIEKTIYEYFEQHKPA